MSGYANMNSVIAGWGQTNQTGNLVGVTLVSRGDMLCLLTMCNFDFKAGLNSKVLMKANVTIQDDSVCTRQYGEEFFVGLGLCASAPGKDTCGVSFSNGMVY